MSKFFTRTGDDSYTNLLGSERVKKSDARIEALGSLDEANAALGVARANCLWDEGRAHLLHIQRDLYGVMGEVAATPENASRFQVTGSQQVAWLEERIDEMAHKVQFPREFIVPGDTPSGAAMDLARAIVRRAERRVVDLVLRGDVTNQDLVRYLNRLSSFCFIFELYEYSLAGKDKPTLART